MSQVFSEFFVRRLEAQHNEWNRISFFNMILLALMTVVVVQKMRSFVWGSHYLKFLSMVIVLTDNKSVYTTIYWNQSTIKLLSFFITITFINRHHKWMTHRPKKKKKNCFHTIFFSPCQQLMMLLMKLSLSNDQYKFTEYFLIKFFMWEKVLLWVKKKKMIDFQIICFFYKIEIHDKLGV